MAAMAVCMANAGCARELGFYGASTDIEGYEGGLQKAPPARLSYPGFGAAARPCGTWPSNLADDRLNGDYANFGCASEANLAAMVANSADLIGPRKPTTRAAERRDRVWENYVKGESTISRKRDDERVQVKSAN